MELRKWDSNDYKKWIKVSKAGRSKEAQDLINSVHTIDLDSNNIGAEGMKSLADALKINSTVHTIDLYNNSIGAEGMKSLASCLRVLLGIII